MHVWTMTQNSNDSDRCFSQNLSIRMYSIRLNNTVVPLSSNASKLIQLMSQMIIFHSVLIHSLSIWTASNKSGVCMHAVACTNESMRSSACEHVFAKLRFKPTLCSVFLLLFFLFGSSGLAVQECLHDSFACTFPAALLALVKWSVNYAMSAHLSKKPDNVSSSSTKPQTAVLPEAASEK